MDFSTPGFPVHHQLPEFTQTHVHWVSDAIQPSHLLSLLSPPSFDLSQHQGLFKWVSSSHMVTKVLELQLQHQSYRWLTNTWKDVQHCSLLEKCKSKLQWDITSHWSGWPSFKSLQITNAGEDMEKRALYYNFGQNVNWYSLYGRWYGESL